MEWLVSVVIVVLRVMDLGIGKVPEVNAIIVGPVMELEMASPLQR